VRSGCIATEWAILAAHELALGQDPFNPSEPLIQHCRCRPGASQPAAAMGLIFAGALSAFFDQDR
jgi:hypothetical protein